MHWTKFYYSFIAAGMALLLGCNSKKADAGRDKKKEVELAMKNYYRLILKMDVDSIVLMYTEDGQIENGPRGRNAIREFMTSLPSLKVISCSFTSDTVEINGGTALQRGRYFLETFVNNTNLKLSGRDIATWILAKDGEWKIRRMKTIPDRSQITD